MFSETPVTPGFLWCVMSTDFSKCKFSLPFSFLIEILTKFNSKCFSQLLQRFLRSYDKAADQHFLLKHRAHSQTHIKRGHYFKLHDEIWGPRDGSSFNTSYLFLVSAARASTTTKMLQRRWSTRITEHLKAACVSTPWSLVIGVPFLSWNDHLR